MLTSRDIRNGMQAELDKVAEQKKIFENLHA
jgi:hypothetical protein